MDQSLLFVVIDDLIESVEIVEENLMMLHTIK